MTRVDEIDTPALVIDVRRMDANIARMAARMAEAGVALRPHFKTSKMIEVARRQLEAGAVGFTCATAAEVAALLDAGIADVFWANATATLAKARAAAEFNRRGRVAVGLDSVELAEPLGAAAREAGTTVPVLVEVDTGLRRTGVLPDRLEELVREVLVVPGLAFEGVYMHEGQLAGLRGEREELRAAGRDAAAVLVAAAESLRAAGIPVAVVSVGSTPGWDSAPFVPGVTEARPGTYVFGDANQLRLGSCALDDCAITVRTTVVSTPRAGELVVDAGIKAMSSDRSNRGDTLGLPLAGDALDVGLEFSRGYEEHGVLAGPGAASARVGEAIRVLPNHACGVVNMWSSVHVVDDGEVVGIWSPVARH